MPTVKTIMGQLKARGRKQSRNIYAKHGVAADRSFGVRVVDLKKIAKTIKGEQELAFGLYDTGNLDAMYLAGIVADGSKMTRKQLESWAKGSAGMSMISEYTVPWVAVESPMHVISH